MHQECSTLYKQKPDCSDAAEGGYEWVFQNIRFGWKWDNNLEIIPYSEPLLQEKGEGREKNLPVYRQESGLEDHSD